MRGMNKFRETFNLRREEADKIVKSVIEEISDMKIQDIETLVRDNHLVYCLRNTAFYKGVETRRDSYIPFREYVDYLKYGLMKVGYQEPRIYYNIRNDKAVNYECVSTLVSYDKKRVRKK